MSQFAGTTFGIGTPTIYAGPQNPFGGSSFGPYGIGPTPPLQQIAQLLQIVPQQLQQLQLLQQQQLQQQFQPFSAGVSGPLGFGLAPQPFAGQASGHVM